MEQPHNPVYGEAAPSLAQTADPIGISDEVITVEMTEFRKGIVGLMLRVVALSQGYCHLTA